MADLDRPSLRFLHAYWQVQRALSARVEDHLQARHGLDLRDFIALGQLMEPDCRTPGDLARALSLPKYVVSRTLERLNALGAVTHAPDPQDARRQIYHLTPAGHALLGATLGTVDDLVQPLLNRLEGREAQLTDLLAELLRASTTPPITPPEDPHDRSALPVPAPQPEDPTRPA